MNFPAFNIMQRFMHLIVESILRHMVQRLLFFIYIIRLFEDVLVYRRSTNQWTLSDSAIIFLCISTMYSCKQCGEFKSESGSILAQHLPLAGFRCLPELLNVPHEKI